MRRPFSCFFNSDTLHKIVNTFTLQTKLIFLYICIIIIPAITFIWYYSNQLFESTIMDVMKSNEYQLEAEKIHIYNNIESMRRAAQIVISDNQFIDYIHTEGPVETNELLTLLNSSINNISRTHYNNPTIEHIRIFSNNDNVMEIWPILFHEKRIFNKEWLPLIMGRNGQELWWYTQNEKDIINRQYVANSGYPTVSLFREMEYVKNEHTGIIQVSMLLENFIPKMYSSIEQDNSKMFLLDSKTNFFHNQNNTFLLEHQLKIDEIKKLYLKNIQKGPSSFRFEHNKKPYLMVSTYLEPLDSYLLNVITIEEIYSEMKQTRSFIIIVTLSLVIILSFLSYLLVSHLLKKMYTLMSSMKSVAKGNLDVNVSVKGPKEIELLAAYFQNMITKIKKLIADIIQREAATKEAELKALKTQIDSHFLYNTLENIKMMAEIEEQYNISDALTSLGEMMRYNLKWKNDFVTLKEEVDHIKNYIEIMNLRLDGRLKLQLNISEEIMEQEILKMSLQPIVENAVKHGITPLIHDKLGIVTVTGEIINRSVLIEVTDNGIGMSKEEVLEINKKISSDSIPEENVNNNGNGIGLRNVNERIQLHYTESYGLQIESIQGQFTKVIVNLPYHIIKGGE